MIRVQTGSRLHFGLLSLPADDHWPGHDGQPSIPARRFGGVGLMVEQPGVRLSVCPSPEWSAEGPLAERALAFAQQFSAAILPTARAQPHQIVIEFVAPEHAGLGTGTQLGLALARALADSLGLTNLGTAELALRVGRGARSALGVHGFARGGFLVDGGKKGSEPVAPLIGRMTFPEGWPVLLVVPTDGRGVHGRQESQAFESLDRDGMPLALTESLCRLVLLGMLPALATRDFAAFGEALSDFNARTGEAFSSLQGGIYANAQVAEVVSFLRRAAIPGVGQSSWGPTVFAALEDTDQARYAAGRVAERFPLSEVALTRARNHGAVVEQRDHHC